MGILVLPQYERLVFNLVPSWDKHILYQYTYLRIGIDELQAFG